MTPSLQACKVGKELLKTQRRDPETCNFSCIWPEQDGVICGIHTIECKSHISCACPCPQPPPVSFAWETPKKGEGSRQSAISENPDTNQSAAPSHPWESQRVLKQMNCWRCFKSGQPQLILEKEHVAIFSLKLKRIVGEVEESDKLEFLGLPFQHSTKVDDTMIKRKPFLVRTN